MTQLNRLSGIGWIFTGDAMKQKHVVVKISLLILVGSMILASAGLVAGENLHGAINFSNQVTDSRHLILNKQGSTGLPGTGWSSVSTNGSGLSQGFMGSQSQVQGRVKAMAPMVINFTPGPIVVRPLTLPSFVGEGFGLPGKFLDASYQTATIRPVVPGGTKKPATGGNTGKDVVEANNRFAFELYSNIDKNPDSAGKNIFYSPFSISTVLALVYEGARGNTADQIQEVFHFPTDNTTRRSEYSAVIDGLNNGNTGYTLNTANALWAEKTSSFLPAYTSVAKSCYDADTRTLDFIHQPEQSRTTINNWVAGRTHDKIKDLLPAGSIDPSTRLVITNAIYFKGTWVKQFDKDQTQDAPFTVAPGQTVTVSMMQRTDEDAVYNYTETDSMQVLDMPYTSKGGKSLSMLVVLPKSESVDTTEASLAGTVLADLRNKLTQERVMVFFPKFKLETQYGLTENLESMGMPVAFSGDADFSGMDGKRDLLISEVFHKAYIDVNEEGTEAAAATGAVISYCQGFDTPPPIPVFNADHPFVFFITDDDTGNILFMGRVTNPDA